VTYDDFNEYVRKDLRSDFHYEDYARMVRGRKARELNLHEGRWTAPEGSEIHAMAEMVNVFESMRAYMDNYSLEVFQNLAVAFMNSGRLTSAQVANLMEMKRARENKAMGMTNVDAKLAQMLLDRQEKEETEHKLALLEEYPDDDFPNGTIFRFTKQFEKDGVKFLYGAIKVNNLWYLSGPTQGARQYTWKDLALWLVSGHDFNLSVPFDALELAHFDSDFNAAGVLEAPKPAKKTASKSLSRSTRTTR